MFFLGMKKFITKDMICNVEIENNIYKFWRIKNGFEYEIDSFILRCGFHTNPLIPTFGIGFIISKLTIAISTQYHNKLGYSLSSGFKWRLDKLKDR